MYVDSRGGSWSVFLRDCEREVVDQVFHRMFFCGEEVSYFSEGEIS